MLGVVEFSSGHSLPLTELVHHVPSTAFMGETKVVVAELLSRGVFDDDPDARRVYINAIVRKSPRVRAALALVTLCRHGNDPVTRIESDFIDDRFSELLGPGIELVCHPPRSRNLLKRKEVLRFLGKSICHRAMNLLGSLFPKPDTDSVVRAWVDTTDSTFPEQVDQHPLLVFPFTRRISRQLKYLQRCRRRNRKFCLTGIPYRVRDMIRVALDWKRRDRHIVRAEVNGFQRMADRWIRAGIKNVYTTDEFEVASCILHDRLKQSGGRSINRSHGISTYGPNVSYSVFRCHTSRQMEFYRRLGNVEEFELKSNNKPDLHRLNSADENYEPLFIYLLGSWNRAGKWYEANLEVESARALAEVSAETGIPVIGKAHPNTSDAEIEQMSRSMNIKVVRNLTETENQHPIFFTLLSTAYFDYCHKGPAMVFADQLIQPQVLFGDQIETVSVETAREVLWPFVNADFWVQSFMSQLSHYEAHRLPNPGSIAQPDPVNMPRSQS